jgi:hypothetical protein
LAENDAQRIIALSPARESFGVPFGSEQAKPQSGTAIEKRVHVFYANKGGTAKIVALFRAAFYM